MCSCITVCSVYKLKKEKVPVAAIKMTLKHFHRIKGKKQGMSLPERQLTSFVFQMKCAITIHLYLIFSILLKSQDSPLWIILSCIVKCLSGIKILFSCVNRTTKVTCPSANKQTVLFCSAEQFVVKSLLDPMLFFSFTSVWATLLWSRSSNGVPEWFQIQKWCWEICLF